MGINESFYRQELRREMSYEIREFNVCRVSKDRIQERRGNDASGRRRAFIRFVAGKLDVDEGVFSDHGIHHIVQLSLGGTNNYDNLCLIKTNDHGWATKYVEDRVSSLTLGQKATVKIPVPIRPLVWGMEKIFNAEVLAIAPTWVEGSDLLEIDWMGGVRNSLSRPPLYYSDQANKSALRCE